MDTTSFFGTPAGHTFVVAEIGKNFIETEDERSPQEYLENAKRLTALAKEAGADAVKFQTHSVEDEVLPIEFDSPHFSGMKRYDWVRRNTRSTPQREFWTPLKEYAASIGISFFSTPMSRSAAFLLEDLGVPFWKVGSGDILDFPMLDYIASTKKPVIISSGMSTLDELDTSLTFLKKRNVPVMLLHAISRYPYPPEDSNIGTISFFKKRYPGIPIGFSQNSPWHEPAVYAVAHGAELIEQHITEGRALWGPDHKVSMIPDEFKTMTTAIREIDADSEKKGRLRQNPSFEHLLGTESKQMQEGERAFEPLFRKALVASRDLPGGTVIEASMVNAMRPRILAGGLPSEAYEEVVGKRLIRAHKKFEPFTYESIA